MRTLQIISVMFSGLLICASTSLGGVIAGPAINPANAHPYYLLDANSWTDSEAQAVALGGHLATINDQAEQDWVFNIFSSGRNLWIGLNDAAEEGTFVWISGEAFTYSNWTPLEPNTEFDEDYVTMNGFSPPNYGKWNDIDNEGGSGDWILMYGVVEIPEPATMALLALGGLALIGRRRKK